MAIVFLQEFKIDGDDRSTTNYDSIMSQLDMEANPPDGLVVHTAGWDEDAGVFRILDVWESQEHGETCARRSSRSSTRARRTPRTPARRIESGCTSCTTSSPRSQLRGGQARTEPVARAECRAAAIAHTAPGSCSPGARIGSVRFEGSFFQADVVDL